MDKLNDVSKNVIATFSAEKVYAAAYEWAKRYDSALAAMLEDKEYSLKVLGIERGADIKKKRKDIGRWSDVKDYISYMYDDTFYTDELHYDYQLINDKETLAKIFKLYAEKYYNEADDNSAWFNRLKDLAEEVGYAREVKLWKKDKESWPGHVGDVSTAIRIAVTGRSNTPDLCQIMKTMGTKRVCERLAHAAKCL